MFLVTNDIWHVCICLHCKDLIENVLRVRTLGTNTIAQYSVLSFQGYRQTLSEAQYDATSNFFGIGCVNKTLTQRWEYAGSTYFRHIAPYSFLSVLRMCSHMVSVFPALLMHLEKGTSAPEIRRSGFLVTATHFALFLCVRGAPNVVFACWCCIGHVWRLDGYYLPPPPCAPPPPPRVYACVLGAVCVYVCVCVCVCDCGYCTAPVCVRLHGHYFSCFIHIVRPGRVWRRRSNAATSLSLQPQSYEPYLIHRLQPSVPRPRGWVCGIPVYPEFYR